MNVVVVDEELYDAGITAVDSIVLLFLMGDTGQ